MFNERGGQHSEPDPNGTNYSSRNCHVSAPSNRRTRTEAMSAGSKLPRFNPCRAPGVRSIGSQWGRTHKSCSECSEVTCRPRRIRRCSRDGQ